MNTRARRFGCATSPTWSSPAFRPRKHRCGDSDANGYQDDVEVFGIVLLRKDENPSQALDVLKAKAGQTQ